MGKLAFVTVAVLSNLYTGSWMSNYKTYGPATVDVAYNGSFKGTLKNTMTKASYPFSGKIVRGVVSGTVKVGADTYKVTGKGTYGVHNLDWRIVVNGAQFRIVGRR